MAAIGAVAAASSRADTEEGRRLESPLADLRSPFAGAVKREYRRPTLPPTLAQAAPGSSKLRVKMALTIMRHGDRTPLTTHMGTAFQQSAAERDLWARVLPPDATLAEWNARHPVRPIGLTPVDIKLNEHPNGQLTAYGAAQMRYIGTCLRAAYVHETRLLPAVLPTLDESEWHHGHGASEGKPPATQPRAKATSPAKASPPPAGADVAQRHGAGLIDGEPAEGLTARRASPIVVARSTNISRCIQSLQNVLLGLYPAPGSADPAEEATSFSLSAMAHQTTAARKGLDERQAQARAKARRAAAAGGDDGSDAFADDDDAADDYNDADEMRRMMRKVKVPIYVRPFDAEYMFAGAGSHACSAYRELAAIGAHTINADPDLAVPEVAYCVRAVFGIGARESVPWAHVRELLACRVAHGLPLPQGASLELLDAVSLIAAAQARAAFSHMGSTITRLAIGRLVGELSARLTKGSECTLCGARAKSPQFRGRPHLCSHPRMVLYLGHDSTLLPLLCVLGANDGTWPVYGATMTVELLERKLDNGGCEQYVRVLYDNRELTLPGQPHSVCTLADFNALLAPYVIRDEAAYRQLCDPAHARALARARGAGDHGSRGGEGMGGLVAAGK